MKQFTGDIRSHTVDSGNTRSYNHDVVSCATPTTMLSIASTWSSLTMGAGWTKVFYVAAVGKTCTLLTNLL